MFSSGNIVNELHDWIEKLSRVIKYLNISDSIPVKVNGTILKQHNQMLQISVHDLHNDLRLPVSKGGFYGARN